MRRPGFIIFIILVALLLVACGMFESPQLKNEAYFPAVVFSEDEATVSIYFNGYAAVSPNSCAFTQSPAEPGRDFFEAKIISAAVAHVFQYPLLD